jgi:hypothetical protein
MSERWFHERTPDGWVIRDENRLTVATVPDGAHERESDAKLVVSAHQGEAVLEVLRLSESYFEGEVEKARNLISDVVKAIAADAAGLTDSLEKRGPEGAGSNWLALHVEELARAQRDLEDKRGRLDDVRRALYAGKDGAA